MNYAIIENNLVVNTAVADAEYAESQGWVELTGGAGIGWSYIDGQFIAPPKPTPTPEEIQAANKTQAESLLQQTDWVEIPSVSDTANNPHLVNYADFITYRLALRAIAVNPPVTVTEWPEKPEESWSSV
jgi:hypothetical protein